MNIIIEKIVREYGLELLAKPEVLTGGFLHKMYKIESTQGTFALKLLNPFIMQRKDALSNYQRAERLESILEKEDIPIIYALNIKGKKMQEVDGKYFYLYDYYDGEALKPHELTSAHCKKMGSILACIHHLDKKEGSLPFVLRHTDWDFYLKKLKESNTSLYAMLDNAMAVIKESEKNGNLKRSELPKILAICHNDMDVKNVLWNGLDYRIIDLECLDYNHPFMELFELALCWAGIDQCELDFSLFQAFIEGYKSYGGELPKDWQTLYDCNNGRLEWLEYNLKRALGIECSEDEKEMGINQAKLTLKQIMYYASHKKQILDCCDNLVKKN